MIIFCLSSGLLFFNRNFLEDYCKWETSLNLILPEIR